MDIGKEEVVVVVVVVAVVVVVVFHTPPGQALQPLRHESTYSWDNLTSRL